MDESIRRLEREAAAGDPSAVARLRQARRRAGYVPTAGEYVRLDGEAIGNPEATGNWRVLASLVGADTATLVAVRPDRAPIDGAAAIRTDQGEWMVGGFSLSTVTTLSCGDIAAARVAFDAPLTLSDPLRVPCPKCDAEPRDPCRDPRGRNRRPHVARGVVPTLQAPPPPLPVHVGEARQRPSKVKVTASRNPNAALRLTREDIQNAASVAGPGVDIGT